MDEKKLDDTTERAYNSTLLCLKLKARGLIDIPYADMNQQAENM